MKKFATFKKGLTTSKPPRLKQSHDEPNLKIIRHFKKGEKVEIVHRDFKTNTATIKDENGKIHEVALDLLNILDNAINTVEEVADDIQEFTKKHEDFFKKVESFFKRIFKKNK